MKIKREKLFSLILTLVIMFNCQQPHANNSSSSNLDNVIVKYQQASIHFVFYSTDYDSSSLNDLSAALETNYSRITTDLNTSFSYKVKINIYPDLQTFHNAMEHPEWPDWVVGTGGSGVVNMVSPLNPGPVHSYSSLLKTVVHEFTHVVVSNIKSQFGGVTVPKWLNEGTAYYEANQMSSGSINTLKSLVDADNIPTLDQLNTNNVDAFNNLNGYPFSNSIAEFIISVYGYGKLVELIKTPDNFSVIESGLTKDGFQQKWVQYLKTNY